MNYQLQQLIKPPCTNSHITPQSDQHYQRISPTAPSRPLQFPALEAQCYFRSQTHQRGVTAGPLNICTSEEAIYIILQN